MKNKFCINCDLEFVTEADTNSDFCSDNCKTEYVAGADSVLIANAGEPTAVTNKIAAVTNQSTAKPQAKNAPDGKTFYDLLTNSGNLKGGN